VIYEARIHNVVGTRGLSVGCQVSETGFAKLLKKGRCTNVCVSVIRGLVFVTEVSKLSLTSFEKEDGSCCSSFSLTHKKILE